MAHCVVAMAEETVVTVPRKRKLSLSLKERRFKSVIHQEVSELEKKWCPKAQMLVLDGP